MNERRITGNRRAYLAIIDSEIEMVKSVVGWPVDDLLERMSGDHVRIMDLDSNQLNDK